MVNAQCQPLAGFSGNRRRAGRRSFRCVGFRTCSIAQAARLSKCLARNRPVDGGSERCAGREDCSCRAGPASWVGGCACSNSKFVARSRGFSRVCRCESGALTRLKARLRVGRVHIWNCWANATCQGGRACSANSKNAGRVVCNKPGQQPGHLLGQRCPRLELIEVVGRQQGFAADHHRRKPEQRRQEQVPRFELWGRSSLACCPSRRPAC